MVADPIDALFEPLTLGRITLQNRMAMAPMTRQRSRLDGVPTDLNVEYYRQRATAGLIVSEGVHPSAAGYGYLFAPGLHTPEHVAGWRCVTDAVHAEGGHIFADHARRPPVRSADAARRRGPGRAVRGAARSVGKALHDHLAAREAALSDAARARPRRDRGRGRGLRARHPLRARSRVRRRRGPRRERLYAYAVPHDRHQPARRRLWWRSGGPRPLPDRVRRGDGRGRRTGLSRGQVLPRLDLPRRLRRRSGRHLLIRGARALGRGLAYLSLGDYGVGWDVYGTLRPLFDGPVMVVGGFTRSSAAAALVDGSADIVAFGQAYIANPDLARRYREGLALNRPVTATYYSQGAEGYTDYPAYDAADPAALQPADAAPIPISAERTG